MMKYFNRDDLNKFLKIINFCEFFTGTAQEIENQKKLMEENLNNTVTENINHVTASKFTHEQFMRLKRENLSLQSQVDTLTCEKINAEVHLKNIQTLALNNEKLFMSTSKAPKEEKNKITKGKPCLKRINY